MTETIWERLFGTPERAAETLSERELARVRSAISKAERRLRA